MKKETEKLKKIIEIFVFSLINVIKTNRLTLDESLEHTVQAFRACIFKARLFLVGFRYFVEMIILSFTFFFFVQVYFVIKNLLNLFKIYFNLVNDTASFYMMDQSSAFFIFKMLLPFIVLIVVVAFIIYTIRFLINFFSNLKQVYILILLYMSKLYQKEDKQNINKEKIKKEQYLLILQKWENEEIKYDITFDNIENSFPNRNLLNKNKQKLFKIIMLFVFIIVLLLKPTIIVFIFQLSFNIWTFFMYFFILLMLFVLIIFKEQSLNYLSSKIIICILYYLSKPIITNIFLKLCITLSESKYIINIFKIIIFLANINAIIICLPLQEIGTLNVQNTLNDKILVNSEVKVVYENSIKKKIFWKTLCFFFLTLTCTLYYFSDSIEEFLYLILLSIFGF